MKDLIQPVRFIQITFCCAAFAILFISINSLTSDIKEVAKLSKKHPIQPGFAFNNLKQNLKPFKTVGFLTSKDMSSEDNDGEFLMAQYALAPISLDLNTVRKVNIISPTSKKDLMAILKKNNLRPLSVNKHGKTIAVKIK